MEEIVKEQPTIIMTRSKNDESLIGEENTFTLETVRCNSTRSSSFKMGNFQKDISNFCYRYIVETLSIISDKNVHISTDVVKIEKMLKTDFLEMYLNAKNNNELEH
uniref:Uncharacterized protein n=1 Tax=Parastrongyloides trichosuri TaxID=131310 RepID=A0A0N4ZNI3_PARTI